MFERHRVVAGVIAVAVALGGTALWTAEREQPRSHTASRVANAEGDTVASTRLPSEREIRERDIAFFEQRVSEDSSSAIDRRMLASLLMGRARSSGSVGDYARAEGLLRASLTLREARNEETFALLASALLARHDFVGARAVAARADSLDPGVPSQVALLGEVELELGDYDAARRHFSTLWYNPDQFTIAARMARWHELTGHADSARLLLQRAVRRVSKRDDLPREQVSWFHYRLGELDMRAGALDSAQASFDRGLAVWPDDYRILGALARLAAMRGEWERAIEYGNRAVAIQLDPATLGTISSAYRALGDSIRAREYAHAMTVSALKQPGTIHRAWGLFLLDHGTPGDVRRVLAKVRRELETRHDVYGYDLLAWALHKRGDDRAASEAMVLALSQHTEDAQLYAHAAVIARSLGDEAKAQEYVGQARRVNPLYRLGDETLATLASGGEKGVPHE